ncbi:hypothetical protein DYE48_16865 [Halobacillus trueperi]|uniref:Uncharacterized protein n=1 Tax=Halobacillus trueperi TaxID=156205 RepID=A0A3E0J2L2_9BACI|nr:hypothetical protein DYE48_16865 [Halobacillus trueperi]
MYVFMLESIALIEALLFTPLSLFCFFLLEWVLLQGTVYWFLKWKRISQKKKTELHESQYHWFGRLKKTNLVLLILASGLWVIQWVFSNEGNWWALFLLVFAIGEHINYYHTRLSYQTPAEWKDWKKRGWQRSVLARELSNHKRVKQIH